MNKNGKRTARAKVILDYDDLKLLKTLENQFLQSDKKNISLGYADGLDYDKIKKALNWSHPSLLLHIRRLVSYNFIVSLKSTEDSQARFRGQKIFFVCLRLDGYNFLKKFERLLLLEDDKP